MNNTPFNSALFGLVCCFVSTSMLLAEEKTTAADAAPLSVSPPPTTQKATPAGGSTKPDLSPEQIKRQKLIETHGETVADAILASKVLKDMTAEQVLLARGEPRSKEFVPPDAELWRYPVGEVAFENGKVRYVALRPVMEKIAPDAVFTPATDAFREGVGDTITIMRKLGASSQALAFAQSNPDNFFMTEFVKYGTVDLAICEADEYFSFANPQGPYFYLINGNPAVIAIKDYEYLRGLRLDDNNPWSRSNPPGMMSFKYVEFQSHMPQPGGGQRFIFRFPIYKGGHAGGIYGYVPVAYDFDGSGRFLGARLERPALPTEKRDIPQPSRQAVSEVPGAVPRPRVQVGDISNSLGIEMVPIPGGVFETEIREGNFLSYSDDRPRRLVQVTKFALAKYEVTQEQWIKVMGSNPSFFRKCGTNCPIEWVNFRDVQNFIDKANRLTGRHFRLPSEVEWEYACRGGRTNRYCGSDRAEEIAWFRSNSGKSTHPVGSKVPNGFGLYDMSGNVAEWVCHAYSDTAPETQRKCPNAERQVYRGGSWLHLPEYITTTGYDIHDPADRGSYLGLRLAHDL